ncbi:hypothetical protein SAMN04489751_0930 [Brevibacterium sandarakinum]|uniref:Uncharacterized protein n=1 Tax=Brevibacterium sandarakinum TaxID=629680 RepID=A0A1H1NED9_BRESA|nr:hypothetical protein SAMN04489751_0930 [Brevibacterium sandarakinum]
MTTTAAIIVATAATIATVQSNDEDCDRAWTCFGPRGSFPS